MNEQSLIQVRVDNRLKQEAIEILNEIGMDMPNAIRMYLRRIIIEHGIPFDTKLPPYGKVFAEIDPPTPKDMATIPPKLHGTLVPQSEYIDLICQVPVGKITRSKDIEAHLAKEHGVDYVQIEQTVNIHNPLWEGIPLWRVVSARGMLQDTFLCSKDEQRKKLIEDGLKIVAGGSNQRSLKVEDYQKHLFTFEMNEQSE